MHVHALRDIKEVCYGLFIQERACTNTRIQFIHIYTYLLISMHIYTVYMYIGQGWIRLNIAQINSLLGHSQGAKAASKGRTSPVGMKKTRVQQVWTTAGQPDIRNCGKTRPITNWLVCCSYSEPHQHDPGLGLVVGASTALPRERWVIINIWHRNTMKKK